jgi:hypothetical protein
MAEPTSFRPCDEASGDAVPPAQKAAAVQESTGDPPDRFIPIRKSDVLAALVEQGTFTTDAERQKFQAFCETLASIFHYEYFAALERLRNDYYYFNPEIAPHPTMDADALEASYEDLLQSLEAVLARANFVELPHADIDEAHRRRSILRVKVTAPLDDFRDVRFYRRGHHREQFEVRGWFGLRRRKIEVEVYDDVVLLAATKSKTAAGAPRRSRSLDRRKIPPGAVLLKCFRNIASGDLNALFPNARVVLSRKDMLFLGLPALAGGIPILLKIYATITVLFLLLGFYFGVGAAMADSDTKTALAALSGLVALGGFVARQWVKYQRQSLKYQMELTDNIYYRNVNNNAGMFDYVIGAAEEQDCKEAFLAYHFLRVAAAPPTANELEARVEAWLKATFGIDVEFEVSDALAKLARLGLIERRGERLVVLPLEAAFAELRGVWDKFFGAKIFGAKISGAKISGAKIDEASHAAE